MAVSGPRPKWPTNVEFAHRQTCHLVDNSFKHTGTKPVTKANNPAIVAEAFFSCNFGHMSPTTAKASSKKLRKKYAEFATGYGINLELTFIENYLVSSQDFNEFINSDPERFRTLSKAVSEETSGS